MDSTSTSTRMGYALCEGVRPARARVPAVGFGGVPWRTRRKGQQVQMLFRGLLDYCDSGSGDPSGSDLV